MNLRELKSFVYSLIQDPGEEACQFGEVVSYLNIGQSVLASVLWNIEREKFLGIAQVGVRWPTSGTSTTTAGTFSTTQFQDSASSATTHVAGYYVTVITATQAANVGLSRQITSWGSNITVTAAWPATWTVGDTYYISPVPASSSQVYNSSGDYLCPSDLNEIVRLTLAGVECNRHPVRELNALTKNTLYRPVRGVQQFFSEIGDSVGKTKVRVAPVPALLDTMEVWYFKKPTDFHELGTCELTSTSGSTTTVTCATAPMIGSGGDSSFWLNAEIRLTSGSSGLIGQKRRVTSYDSATGVFTFDALAASAGTNTFELDQVSIIPSQHHHLIGYYAAALAAPKKGMDPNQFWSVWNDHMGMLKRKYHDNVEANIAGESPTGVRGASAAV